jgi:hypothetical protein
MPKTNFPATIESTSERWYFDVSEHAVKDENGLVVVLLRDSVTVNDGALVAAAPHALALVIRMTTLLDAVLETKQLRPAWKTMAKELSGAAHKLIADPGSIEN